MRECGQRGVGKGYHTMLIEKTCVRQQVPERRERETSESGEKEYVPIPKKEPRNKKSHD